MVGIRRQLGSINQVALSGSLLGLISLAVDWLTVSPNRLLSGQGRSLWDSFGAGNTALISLFWLTCLTLSFAGQKPVYSILQRLLANLILVGTLVLAGSTATDIVARSPALTRVSLSPGILISSAGALIIILASRRQPISNRFLAIFLTWAWLPILVALLATGWFNNLSVLQEYFNNSSRFQEELVTHMMLFGISIAAGIVIGVPLGIWAARSRKANRPIFFLANITQTIPSLALFGLLIAPLSALSTAFPFLQDIGIRGIGAAPAIIALVIYSLLPIIQNTYTGIHQISPGVIDAGSGMGMNRSELLRRVELPLASPLILTGIRTAAVQTIGTVAVAALIGAGGMGQLIFQGLGQAATDLIILGSVPIILIALAIDNIMQFVVKISTPGGIAEPAS